MQVFCWSFSRETWSFIWVFRSCQILVKSLKFKESITTKTEAVVKNLTIKEQLFVTLLRLRCSVNLYTILFMYQHFRDYLCLNFPERNLLKHLLPKVLCSVESTELLCEILMTIHSKKISISHTKTIKQWST